MGSVKITLAFGCLAVLSLPEHRAFYTEVEAIGTPVLYTGSVRITTLSNTCIASMRLISSLK